MESSPNNKYSINVVQCANVEESNDDHNADYIDLVSLKMAIDDVTTLIEMVRRCQFTLAAKYQTTEKAMFRSMFNNLCDMLNTHLKRQSELQDIYEAGIRAHILVSETERKSK